MRLSLGSWAGWKKLLIDQFMLISYAIAAIIALTWPAPGRAVNDVTISINGKAYQVFTVLCIMIVFLISGLALDTGDVKRALKYKMGVAFGFISTLAITPCLGFAYREIPLSPDEFTVGLVVNTLVPQTLGIGVSLVRSMMGNEGLALLLTVGTNFIGVFTMPLWLKGLFAGSTLGEGQGFTLSIGIVALLVNLIITVMVPSLIGKVLRDFIPAVRRWVTRYRTPLALFSTLHLAIVIWMVLSGAQSALVQQPFVGVVYVCLLSAAQHLLFLLFNGTMSWFVLRLPDPESTSTAIMASQKSGPVSVAVISYITSDPSTQGLMAIPAVLGQLIQAFIGSAFVPYLANRNAAYLDAQDKAAEAAAAAAAGGGLANGAGGAAGTGAAAGAVAEVELELGKGPSGEVLEGAAAAWEGSQAGKPTAAAAAPPGSQSSPAFLQLALSGRSSRLLELEGRSSLQLMASAILGMGRWGQADEDGPAGSAADGGGHAASLHP